jgi:hypothetical protein
MQETPGVIGTCLNCISPGSLSATLALIVIGAGIAWTAEGRKLARDAKRSGRGKHGHLIAPAISEEAQSAEAQDHHRPGGGFGDGSYRIAR